MNSQPPPDAPEAPVLDEETVALIAAAIDAEAPDAAASTRIKERLLRRIAADCTDRHLTRHAADGAWQPFGAGVQMKVLHEAGGVMSYLIRLAPGAALPAHRHPLDEECVVLEGEVAIGDLRVAAGGFHLGRKGVLHDELTSAAGALIFLRGAVPEMALVL